MSFLIERKKEGGLLSVELLTLAYMLITTVMIGLHYGNLPSPDTMLGNRVMMLCIMAATNVAYRIYPCRLSVVLRVVPIILGLILSATDMSTTAALSATSYRRTCVSREFST